jgi:hypothetical protein
MRGRPRKNKGSTITQPPTQEVDKQKKSRSPNQGFQKGHPGYKGKKKDIPPDQKAPTEPKNQGGVLATRFRNDLFWIYETVGGKKALKDMVMTQDGDKKVFDKVLLKDILKLLLTLYSKELDAQIKREAMNGGDTAGKNFIFIMDGLGRGKVMGGAEQSQLPQKILDMMTDPEASVTENSENNGG